MLHNIINTKTISKQKQQGKKLQTANGTLGDTTKKSDEQLTCLREQLKLRKETLASGGAWIHIVETWSVGSHVGHRLAT